MQSMYVDTSGQRFYLKPFDGDDRLNFHNVWFYSNLNSFIKLSFFIINKKKEQLNKTSQKTIFGSR